MLVPNTLDLGNAAVDITMVVPNAVLQQAASIVHWVVEDAKSTRAFLKRVDAVFPLARALQAMDIRELPRARKGAGPATTPADELHRLLEPALAGNHIGLLSEAGLAAVADPGAALVAAAHAAGVTVQALPGASSITLALAASGLNGQRFAFEGYLPQDAQARATRIRDLEARSRREAQTQLAIETPYRNAALASALLAHLQPGTRLSIACGLTLPEGWCRTAAVARWRDMQIPMPSNVPAVFMWLAS